MKTELTPAPQSQDGITSPRSRFASWGLFLKRHRRLRFRSAREFCLQAAVSISYPQYSRYEAGEQLPSLDQALGIARLLEIGLTEAMLEWNLAQLNNDQDAAREVRTVLNKIRAAQGDGAKPSNASSSLSSTPIELDDVIVFNRSHLKLFSSDPGYRDLFTYLNSFSPEPISVEEVLHRVRLPRARGERMLRDLHDLGVITMNGGKCRISKSNLYFPDDEDFFPLRNSNLSHNIEDILSKIKYEDLQKKRAYRGLITRELTEEQVQELATRLDVLMNQVVAASAAAPTDGIYSVCVVLGQRFARGK